jgi:hypothetical protein
MYRLDQGNVQLELFVRGPAQTALGLTEVIEQDKQLFLSDRLSQPGLVRRTLRWMNLGDKHVAKEPYEITKQSREILACLCLSLHDGKSRGGIAVHKRMPEIKDGLARGESENTMHICRDNRVSAEGNHLIEHRLGIAHRTVRPLGYGFGGGDFQGEVLVFRYEEKVAGDLFWGQPAQVEALAAT